MGKDYKAQISLEYLYTLIAGVSIAAVSLYAVFALFSASNRLIPFTCNFNLGIACQDLIIASNSANTMFALLGTNSRDHAIQGLGLNVILDGRQTSMQCTPNTIGPGQLFVCLSQMNLYKPAGSYAGGNITTQLDYCGLNGGDCSATLSENYVGKYSTTTSGFSDPRFNLMVSDPTYNANGSVSMNVDLNVFGNKLPLSGILLPANEQVPIVIRNGTSLEARYLNVSASSYGGCIGTVSAELAGMSASKSFTLLPPVIVQGGSFGVSGNSNRKCVTLSGAASGGVSGNSNYVCILADTAQTINLATSGNHNTVFMLTDMPGETSLTESGNHNSISIIMNTSGQTSLTESGNNNDITVRMNTVGEASIVVSGNYNDVSVYNSTVSIRLSGNHNTVHLYNSTVTSKVVSGNDNNIYYVV